MTGPLLLRCPVCNARPWEPCNAPTDTGRRSVAWFHLLREDRASGTEEGLL